MTAEPAPPPPAPDDAPAPAAGGAASRWRSRIGFIVGLLLFIAAIFALLTGEEDLRQAWRSMRAAPYWLVALVVGLPVANLVGVSMSFWLISRRYGKVGPGEMNALVATAWLLNYLPMKPGLIGRLAYHKKINNIRYRDSARVLVWAASFTAISTLVMFALAALVKAAGVHVSILLAPLPVIALGTLIAVRAEHRRAAHAEARPRRGHAPVCLGSALVFRYIDMLIWAARYWASFKLVGVDIDPSGAAILAVISQVTLAIPVAGNGLGVREWGIGVAAQWLGFSVRAVGLAADVINRAAELVVSIPLGLAGWIFITIRLRRNRIESSEPPDPADLASRHARTYGQGLQGLANAAEHEDDRRTDDRSTEKATGSPTARTTGRTA